MLGKFEELLAILVVVLVLFGSKSLPDLTDNIVQTVNGSRKGKRRSAKRKARRARASK